MYRYNGEATSTFSAHSQGLRKVLWSCQEWEDTRHGCVMDLDANGRMFYIDKDVFRLAFEKNNPFDDPRAHNCLLALDCFLDATTRSDKSEAAQKHLKFEEEVLQRKLNELMKAAGKIVSPIVH